ncbi:MAG TPA: SbcC/MukB-like Walker B domain-containing protein, partial [Mycobacteriales bacterium]|nr:SbcC/MukB-like Walker B domain-containing protein [Mycobacteriales bacterium]
LSLLVPAAHHAAVTAWVDREHLGQRLVTYRVADPAVRHGGAAPGTVASKLVVKPGEHASRWITAEIARRFDHQCVTDPADLAGHDRALSRAGQVKDNNRQEKDDRSRVDDRLSWVLGWDTRDRRAALEAARRDLLAAVTRAEAEMARVKSADDDLAARDRAVATLASQFTDPARVDVAAARAAQQAAADHVETLRSDPEIAALSERLTGLSVQLSTLGDKIDGVVGKIATTEAALKVNRAALEDLDVAELTLSPQAARILERARKDAGTAPTALAGVERWGRAMGDKVEDHAAAARRHHSGVEQALIGAMTVYGGAWTARVVDIDTSNVAGRVDLLTLRDRLIADDLPRFEKDFRDKLQSNAINEIAMFSRKLDTDSADIADRIATINSALADIDYQPGTRIELAVEPTKDQQVRDFRAQLKAITTGMVGAGDGAYNEAKFLAVRELLDRFHGRKDYVEEDKRWLRRVTDVRNWHTFAATERSRDEDTLVEHYSDSDGKSGGQKEKLAYTILAASLAYQYGLAEGDTRGFRFVMIDEAFGRGSEESTRYGLDLFGRLGLQLLVVTPLQKISTIEQYVQAVGYIGKTGATSRLRSMTVEEYRELRADRLTGLPSAVAAAAGAS